MDLFVNGRFLTRPVTGVERYGREVLQRLGGDAKLILPRSARRGVLGHLWEQGVLPSRLPKQALLWSPANTGPLRSRRQVVTLHDLAPIHHPEWFRPWFAAWYRWLLPRLARRARRVLTVSFFSRDCIIGDLAVPEENVDVAPPGVGPPFRPVSETAAKVLAARHGLDGPYLLWVGTLEPRKNLRRLLRAWAAVAPDLPDVSLALVGSPGRAFPTAKAEGAVRVRRLGRVSDDDLAALYSGALALVYIPLYEGFGLPPLEAMACGCPVLASRAGGLPEAVGEAALFVEPQDEAAIAGRLGQLVVEVALRRRLGASGLEHARAFSWERTAQAVRQSLEAAWAE